MQWQIVVALVLAIPIAVFPVAYMSYLTLGGIYAAIRETRKRRAVAEEAVRVPAK